MSNQQPDLYRTVITTLAPRRVEVVNYDIRKLNLFTDAIAHCLFDESRDGQPGGWLREGEKSGAITVEFSVGGVEYRVVKTCTQSGKATLAFNRRAESGGWEDAGGITMKLTQEKIAQTLGSCLRVQGTEPLHMDERAEQYADLWRRSNALETARKTFIAESRTHIDALTSQIAAMLNNLADMIAEDRAEYERINAEAEAARAALDAMPNPRREVTV